MQKIFHVMMVAVLVLGGFTEQSWAATEDISMTTPHVILKTTKGDIKIALNTEKAPVTVENFITYVNEDFYNGTIFHRVIPGFMIQGGGFTADMAQKSTHAPIKNEAGNGLKNERGTIAMARTSDPQSATAQFFINVADNGFLNFTSATAQGYGYAVFGKVVEGMDVVDAIAAAKTGNKGGYQDVPVEPIVITSAETVGMQLAEPPAAAEVGE